MTGAADQEEELIEDEDGGESWVAPERSSGAGPAAEDDIPTIGEEAGAHPEVQGFALLRLGYINILRT